MDGRKLWELIADTFNKTVLGLGVMLAGYNLIKSQYISAAIIIFVLVPVYFYLYKLFWNKE